MLLIYIFKKIKSDYKMKKIFILTITTILLTYLLVLFPLQFNEFYGLKNFTYKIVLNKNIQIDNRELESSIYVSDNAIKNIFYFNHANKKFTPKYGLDNIWKGTYDNNTHEFYTHSLIILDDLLLAHKNNNNDDYLKKGIEIINSWIENHSRYNISQSEFPWGDHSTSNRVISIIDFIDYSANFIKIDEIILKKITKDLNQSAKFLYNKYNYKNNNNHGIFQDLALLKISNHIVEKEIDDFYTNITTDRFAEQISNTYSDNGFHLENSPGYHIWITDLANRYIKELKENNKYNKLKNNIVSLINTAECNKFYFLTNQEMIVPVGDSIYYKYKLDNKCTDYTKFIADSVAGYQVYKDSKFYLLSKTQSPLYTHRHEDNMSFIYELNNELIIDEVGFLDYTGSKDSLYANDKSAHNSFYIEGDKKKHESQFYLPLNNNDFFRTSMNTNYDNNNNINRDILLDKKNDTLIINDKIRTETIYNWVKLLQYGIDIKEVYKENCKIILITKNNKKFYVNTYVNKKQVCEELFFDNETFMLGFRAKSFDKLIPNNTSKLNISSDTYYNVLTIISKNENSDYNKYYNQLENISYEKVEKKIDTRDYKRNSVWLYDQRLSNFLKISLIIIVLSILLIILIKKYVNVMKVIYLTYISIISLDIYIFWKLFI